MKVLQHNHPMKHTINKRARWFEGHRAGVVRRTQVFILLNNNQVCSLFCQSLCVWLHCVGRFEGREMWHLMRVCVCVNVREEAVVSESTTKTKTAVIGGNRWEAKKPNVDAQNRRRDLKRSSVTWQTAAWPPHKTTAGSPSTYDITQSARWHFEPLSISSFHNDHNKGKVLGAEGEHNSRRGGVEEVDYISWKKIDCTLFNTLT